MVACELGARATIECSELSGVSCGSWETQVSRAVWVMEVWRVGFRGEFGESLKGAFRPVGYFELRDCHSGQLRLNNHHD